jgi:hypothetical protein
MTVIAIFKYQVKPGRMPDFIAKLQEAGPPPVQQPGDAEIIPAISQHGAGTGYRTGHYDDRV